MEDESPARHVVEEDPDGLTARQLERLLGDHVEQALAIEAGGQLPRHRVEPGGFLLARARLGVEPALLERHGEVLAQRAERLDALPADRPTARLVVGADDADHAIADDERRDDESARAQKGAVEARPIEREHPREIRIRQDGDRSSGLQGLVVGTGFGGHRQPESGSARRRRSSPARSCSEPSAVSRNTFDAVEADDVARGANEGAEPSARSQELSHRDRGMREPLEQGATVLGLAQQSRLLDRERRLVGQRRQQRDVVRQEVPTPR